MPRRLVLALGILTLAVGSPASALGSPAPYLSGFRMEILIDGRPVCEYPTQSGRYIEAIKGRDYSIRLHNPLPVRVAVALAVDGLNTIDAKHTSAREARKWVLGPYETITISGWQMSMSQARRFYFTSEEASYARRLGQPANIGVISAVFFRERTVHVIPLTGPKGEQEGPEGAPSPASPQVRQKASEGAAAGLSAVLPSEAKTRSDANEFAATGIGERTDHAVRRIHLDLEDQPAASIDVHYEYRPELVRLGILPKDVAGDRLEQRRRAHGFEGGFCPDVP